VILYVIKLAFGHPGIDFSPNILNNSPKLKISPHGLIEKDEASITLKRR
jgi:hypothetical protein